MDNNENNGIIIGRNAVNEAINSHRTIDNIYILKGKNKGAILNIIKKAKELGIPIKEADENKLNSMCSNKNHQGIIAVASAYEYASIDDIFNKASKKNEPPFIIIADGLCDPHNLGAIIRTAECAGAHGIIIPKRRSVSLTYTVCKAAAGALEYVDVCRVTNIANTLDELKKRGLWIYAADMDGESWCSQSLTGAIGIVIGSEGFGISRLVKEKCDVILSLPMCGNINSLNASVAAGIIMYEVTRQRLAIKAIP